MTYEEFSGYLIAKCMYETIYNDSEGRSILVIDVLDAYEMVNKAPKKWVGLTDEEFHDLQIEHGDDPWANFKAIEAKLKEKNGG